MKAIFAVISIGFLALANGTCLPPIVCTTEPAVPGAILCGTFCLSIGANIGACTTSNFPTNSRCQCIGPRVTNPVTDLALDAYVIALPPVCAFACALCSTQTDTATIDLESDAPNVFVLCNCRPL